MKEAFPADFQTLGVFRLMGVSSLPDFSFRTWFSLP